MCQRLLKHYTLIFWVMVWKYVTKRFDSRKTNLILDIYERKKLFFPCLNWLIEGYLVLKVSKLSPFCWIIRTFTYVELYLLPIQSTNTIFSIYSFFSPPGHVDWPASCLLPPSYYHFSFLSKFFANKLNVKS